jgi:hypothetical protein
MKKQTFPRPLPPPNETIGGISKFESNLWFVGIVLAFIAFIIASALGFGHKK